MVAGRYGKAAGGLHLDHLRQSPAPIYWPGCQGRHRHGPADGGHRTSRPDDAAGAGGGDLMVPSLVTNIWQGGGRRHLRDCSRGCGRCLPASPSARSSARFSCRSAGQRPSDALARRRLAIYARSALQNEFQVPPRAELCSVCVVGSRPARSPSQPASSRCRGCLISRPCKLIATGWCRRSACLSPSRPSRSPPALPRRRNQCAADVAVLVALTAVLAACGSDNWCAATSSRKPSGYAFSSGCLLLGAHLALRSLL